MTQWRFPDDLSDESRLEGLVQLALDGGDFPGYPYDVVRALLLAGYTDACTKVAKTQRDHFVGRATLRRYMSDTVIEALARRLDDDEPGLLHRHGDTCRCLSNHDARWPGYVEFAVHDFLASNPSRAERELNTLRKKEILQLRAEALRAWWFACAYCRARPATLNDHVSPRSLTLDHVDPYTPGVVVPACRACNSAKGQRTADEWGRRLCYRPAEPARDWEHALAESETAFAQADRDAVPIVMAGHGAPAAAAPTPRPRTQADPYLRGRVPAGGADGDPATPEPGPNRLRTGSDPAPDPGASRVRAGPEPGHDPAPDPGHNRALIPGQHPARDPAHGPVAEPVAEGLGREGKGNPAARAGGAAGPPKDVWLASGKPVEPRAGPVARDCRWCGGPVPAARAGPFCSKPCQNEYGDL